jgi:predicted double-glycine peptidase
MGSLALSGLLWIAAASVWLDVPFVRQVDNGCGSSSIAMVMRYWEVRSDRPLERSSDEESIRRNTYDPEAGGVPAGEMVRYLNEAGFRVFTFAGTRRDIEHHLNRGRPLIVCLKEGKTAPLHYVVVAGLRSDPNEVLVNDPARRRLRAIGGDDFDHAWRRARMWTLLAVPE